jgi:hypothetical protein
MSIDTITYLILAIGAAVIIAGFVGIIKLIILWWEVRAWRKGK